MATQKKTAEVDYSMQEKIMALYELQKIDSKIDEINKVKGELPLEVQDLEDEMTGLRTRIDNINAEIEELNTLTKQRKRATTASSTPSPRRSSIRSWRSSWPRSVSRSTAPA